MKFAHQQGCSISKEFVLAPSLAICLPVHNAQASLDRMVRDALEITIDLTPRVEVLVIDDGSVDATSEIAHELSMRYPQVRPLRQPIRIGRAMNMRLAATEATADVVLVRDERCRLSLGEIPKMWRSLTDHDVVFALADQEPARGWSRWVQRLKPTLEMEGKPLEDDEACIDLQMIRRRAIETVRWTIGNRNAQIAELDRHGYRWTAMHSLRHELGTIPAAPAGTETSSTAIAGSQAGTRVGARPAVIRKPNYLKHLRDFALGE